MGRRHRPGRPHRELTATDLLRAEPLESDRLTLRPLAPSDADLLFDVLDDQRLHTYTGGSPATLEQLRDRFELLATERSPDGREAWLNWIVLLKSGEPVGTVQATVTEDVAEVAWVIGVPWQGQGYAGEAATVLVDWLEAKGVPEIRANIHPDHTASAVVARRAGFTPTAHVVDGERVWIRTVPRDQ